jgi:ABC-type polysaccharide/polyol phosphate transport system ATPase subunit
LINEQNGAPRKFYFFLLPSYWLSPSKEKDSVQGDVVQVNDVRKSYGNFDALKGVTMTMTVGEITALLGHNGKT